MIPVVMPARAATSVVIPREIRVMGLHLGLTNVPKE